LVLLSVIKIIRLESRLGFPLPRLPKYMTSTPNTNFSQTAAYIWQLADLVMKAFGGEVADNIEWGGSRLICIAADFNKYDEHAVQQIDRNIELMRYRYFGDELLLLELVNAQTASQSAPKKVVVTAAESILEDTPRPVAAKRKDDHESRKAQASEELLALYESVCDLVDGLGDDVQRKELML